jgi:hypothetical protein
MKKHKEWETVLVVQPGLEFNPSHPAIISIFFQTFYLVMWLAVGCNL